MQARERKPITKGRQIGIGKRSFVYEGEYKGQLCARKETLHDSNKKEIEILKKLQHDNIIKYIDTKRNKQGTETCTLLELCYCNLKQYFTEKCIDLSPIEVLRQVVEGVNYLHNGHTVHGDLNLSHILLQHVEREKKWVVKICGFGSSENLDPDKAPELLPASDGSPGQGKRGKEADIFSLARVFYYLLSDGERLNIKDTKELCELDNAVGDHSADMHGLKNEYKDNAEKLILSMLEKNRMKRVTICEIRSHFLFWKPSKTVLFLQVVSDLTYKNEKHRKLSNQLEAKCLEITDGDWRKKISGKEYPGISVYFETSKFAIKSLKLLGLMRQIRNWAHHYSEGSTSQQLRNDLGSFPDGFTKFCKSKFPLLLPHVYEVMKDVRNCTEMKEFYAADDARLKTDTSSSAFRSKSIGDSKELMLHNYQRELAAQALDGKNSLIIAPTGSGRTAVIAGIIQDHIKKNPDDKTKIIFMVSKTALAHQQYAFLKRYLTTCSVGYVIDEVTKVNPHKIIKSNKVTVLNGQILINELKRKLDTFGDISMLLFDECYRAFGKHPYKQVMDLYYDYRKEIKRNIQIVGVTTYPGISKIKERVTVKENLIQLLVNMGITLAPCTVENNIDELKKYRKMANEYCIVEKADQTSPKLEEVIEAMQAIEKELKDITEENHVTYLSKIPEDRSQEAYEAWTKELKSYGRLEMKDQTTGTKLIAFAENLKMYHVLLQLKDLVPNAMGCVDKMVTTQTEKYEEGFLAKKKRDLQKKEDDDVPMYEKMFENLKKQFENNSEARCIVFVKRELTAERLEECMLLDGTLSAKKPKHITWADSAGIVKDENQILIATAAPKNGFDVGEYNLIVLYNYVPYFDSSSLPKIERIARRDKEGNSRILLMRLKEDKAISFDELDNSIQDLKRIPPEDLVQKIKKKQEEARDWKILCGKCKKFLTTGEKLYRITSSHDFKNTHLYVNDRDFPSRLEKKIDSDRKCRIKIENDMDYPAIPIDKILLRHSNGELHEPKNANNMPFSVKEITEEDSGDEDDMDTANVVPMYQDESFYDDENLEALQMLLSDNLFNGTAQGI